MTDNKETESALNEPPIKIQNIYFKNIFHSCEFDDFLKFFITILYTTLTFDI